MKANQFGWFTASTCCLNDINVWFSFFMKKYTSSVVFRQSEVYNIVYIDNHIQATAKDALLRLSSFCPPVLGHRPLWLKRCQNVFLHYFTRITFDQQRTRIDHEMSVESIATRSIASIGFSEFPVLPHRVWCFTCLSDLTLVRFTDDLFMSGAASGSVF